MISILLLHAGLFWRFFHFIAKKADIVISPIVVNRNEHCRAESKEEAARERKCVRRKIKCHRTLEMSDSRKNYPCNCYHHHNPKKLREFIYNSDFSGQQNQGDHTGGDGDESNSGRGQVHMKILSEWELELQKWYELISE